jgi:hypothetical protein
MLEGLVTTCMDEGWVAATGSIAQLRREAQSLGLIEVSVRRGGPSVTTLRPLDRGDSQEHSLSAKYGKGDQPLHTDGAHLAKPPDVVWHRNVSDHEIAGLVPAVLRDTR